MVNAPIPDPSPPEASVAPESARASWLFPRDAQGRLRLAAYFVTLAIIAIYLFDQVWPSADSTQGVWIFRGTIPVMKPVGIDFHLGVFNPATTLRAGKNPYEIGNWYPPLVAVLGLPFTLLKPGTAYLVHAVGLMLANVVTIWLSMAIAVAVFGCSSPLQPREARGLAQTMMVQMAFFAFTSYPLHFSLERGNTDIYPQLFCVAALYFMLKRPRSMWLQVILVALAVNIKVYPAVLFFLIFWRYRWKSLVPIFVVTGALLFVQGTRVLGFFRDVQKATVVRMSWIGNHSATSFSETALGASGYSPAQVAKVILLICAAMWAIGAAVLWWRRFTPANAVLLFALSIPVMNIVPTVSHDYKLVILTAPLAMVMFACIARFAAEGSWGAAISVVVLLVLAGGISRSYADTATLWLANKCLWVLVMQAVFLAAVLVPGIVSRRRARVVPAPASAEATPR